VWPAGGDVIIASREEALEKMGPYLGRLGSCIWAAGVEYDSEDPQLLATLRPRSVPNVIHDIIERRVEHEFEGTPGVVIARRRGLFTITFHDRFVTRIKKLNPRLQASENLTEQALGFIRQELPEMPPATTAIQAGYVSGVGETMRRVCIVASIGREVVWAIDLERPEPAAIPLPAAVERPSVPPAKRVRVRQDAAQERRGNAAAD
jgi:hypothetical protein